MTQENKEMLQLVVAITAILAGGILLLGGVECAIWLVVCMAGILLGSYIRFLIKERKADDEDYSIKK